MARQTTGQERDPRAVSRVLCRPYAGLTDCTWDEVNGDGASGLDAPMSCCNFENRAAACAAPALHKFALFAPYSGAYTEVGTDPISFLRTPLSTSFLTPSSYSSSNGA